ncbi:MAG: hypothetical protein GXO19_04060 [Epsilonproteobacteria bacterium]|nr:hypothetical protein [Campylobacterota bacterium]NPA56896.1 hypothetical protein [Campylobacterota bacterium]
MKLELDDFSTLHKVREGEEQKEEGKGENNEELLKLQEAYEKRIEELEREYKELLSKVGKESYEQGYRDAEKRYEELLKEEIERIVEQKEAEKEAAIEQVRSTMLNIEDELRRHYREYLGRFTDIVVDSIGEILDFLYIDKSNVPIVEEAIEKLLSDFKSFMPFGIIVSPELYEETREKFSDLPVKVDPELHGNDFVIEFHDFKIENKVSEKLPVIKDEIKRETKKLT